MIRDSRIPIISLYRNLIVPLQGSLTDTLIEQLQTDLGKRIEAVSPKGIIIDVSGIPVLDSYIAKALRDCGIISRLMGVRTVISGMHPLMAMTLVEMGLHLEQIDHTLNLEAALELLLSQRTEFIIEEEDEEPAAPVAVEAAAPRPHSDGEVIV